MTEPVIHKQWSSQDHTACRQLSDVLERSSPDPLHPQHPLDPSTPTHHPTHPSTPPPQVNSSTYPVTVKAIDLCAQGCDPNKGCGLNAMNTKGVSTAGGKWPVNEGQECAYRWV